MWRSRGRRQLRRGGVDGLVQTQMELAQISPELVDRVGSGVVLGGEAADTYSACSSTALRSAIFYFSTI